MAPVSLNFQVYVFVSIRGRGWGDKTQTAVTSKKVQERKALVYHKSQAVGGGGGSALAKPVPQLAMTKQTPNNNQDSCKFSKWHGRMWKII